MAQVLTDAARLNCVPVSLRSLFIPATCKTSAHPFTITCAHSPLRFPDCPCQGKQSSTAEPVQATVFGRPCEGPLTPGCDRRVRRHLHIPRGQRRSSCRWSSRPFLLLRRLTLWGRGPPGQQDSIFMNLTGLPLPSEEHLQVPPPDSPQKNCRKSIQLHGVAPQHKHFQARHMLVRGNYGAVCAQLWGRLPRNRENAANWIAACSYGSLMLGYPRQLSLKSCPGTHSLIAKSIHILAW